MYVEMCCILCKKLINYYAYMCTWEKNMLSLLAGSFHVTLLLLIHTHSLTQAYLREHNFVLTRKKMPATLAIRFCSYFACKYFYCCCCFRLYFSKTKQKEKKQKKKKKPREIEHKKTRFYTMFLKSPNMDQAIAVIVVANVVVAVVHGGCLLTENDSLFHTYTKLFMHACLYIHMHCMLPYTYVYNIKHGDWRFFGLYTAMKEYFNGV